MVRGEGWGVVREDNKGKVKGEGEEQSYKRGGKRVGQGEWEKEMVRGSNRGIQLEGVVEEFNYRGCQKGRSI